MTTCSNASCPRCCARRGSARWPQIWTGSCRGHRAGLHTQGRGRAGQPGRGAAADPDRPPADRARRRRPRRVRRRRSPNASRCTAVRFKHYRTALRATRAVLYHLDGHSRPTAKDTAHLRWPWRRHFDGVPAVWPIRWSPTWNAPPAPGPASTVLGIASRLGALRPVPRSTRPGADLAGRTGSATPHRALPGRGGRRPPPAHRTAPVAVRTALPDPHRRPVDRRHQRVGLGRGARPHGWSSPRDVPRLPRALPRYLPPDADRRLTAALRASPNRLRADALLLLRATGMRIGELLDLELDCVHEVPGAGSLAEGATGQAGHRADGADRRRDPRTRRPDRRAPLARPAAAAPPHRQAGRVPAHPPRTPDLRRRAARRADPSRRRGRPRHRPPHTNSGTPTPPPWSTQGSRCRR